MEYARLPLVVLAKAVAGKRETGRRAEETDAMLRSGARQKQQQEQVG
jgi:hypothetical protein